jgi:signal transduction histidine kinase
LFYPGIGQRRDASVAKVAGSRSRTARVHGVRTRGFLEAAILLGVVVGAAVFYLVVHERTSFLYYFFVPVAAGAVVFGRRLGAAYAALSILLVLVPVVLRGLRYIYGADPTVAEMLASFILWAAFLLATAYAVGWVSEHGGNRVLLQGLGADAITAVERERKRMGFDIHDGIAQVVTTALMEVEVLEALTEDAAPEVKEEVSRLKAICGEAVREIRTMIGHLRPPQLGAEEFPVTLTHLVGEFRDRTGVKVELAIEGDLSTHTDSMRICVYRVVQEALSNVEHHAEASRTRVGVRATKGRVFLTVADDGVGFDAAGYSLGKANGHFGLAGMQERVSLLAGRMEIDSAPGHGTVVSADIPGLRG